MLPTLIGVLDVTSGLFTELKPTQQHRLMLCWCVVLLVACPQVSQAQSKPAPAAEPAIEIKATPELQATLRVNNREITTLRATVGNFTPEERARDIASRIGEILRTHPEELPVTTRPALEGAAFYLGDQFAFVLVHKDLDVPTGETLEQVSADAQTRLAIAVREVREEHSAPLLIESGLWALFATAGLLIFIIFVHRIRIRMNVALQRPTTQPVASVLGLFLRQALSLSFSVVALIVELAAVNLWLTFVLRRFPYTRPWGESLYRNILGVLSRAGLAILRALPGIAVVGFVVVACYLLTRTTNKLFLRIKSGDISVPFIHPEVVPPTRRLVVAAIWLFGLVIAYPNLPGSQTEAFKGISVLLGLLVTLGSSGVFGQAMCGILLMYSRAFKTGDYIRIEETEGTVIEVGALSTKIRTIKNEIVNIPNTLIVNKETKNFSFLQNSIGLIIHTEVTIGYPAPWRQVEALLLMAAARTPGLREDPRPFVLQMALGDYAVRYQLNAFLDRAEEQIPLLALLHSSIQDVFNEYGVQIMTPHYRRDPAEPQIVPRERWFAEPATPADKDPSRAPSTAPDQRAA